MAIRVAIIGLDAATFDVILPLVKGGDLPNMGRLMEKGTWGPLRSTYPPISVPAWVSCITGKGPGEHGLLDFSHYDLKGYGGRGGLVNSHDFAGSTLFDLLTVRGKRLGVFRVPITYPPWPVNGFMVSGQPTPNRCKAYTYPEGLAMELGDLHKEGDIKKFQYLEDDSYLENIHWDTERHIEAAVDLLRKKGEDLDFFMMVLNCIDAVQHRFWKYRESDYPFADSRSEKYRETVNDLYRKVDKGIGALLECLPEDVVVMVVSDHGARMRPCRNVHLNQWLISRGLMVYRPGGDHAALSRERATGRSRGMSIFQGLFRNKKAGTETAPVPEGDGVDWSKTMAYRFPMYPPVDGIAVNLSGRQSEGCVKGDREYERIRTSILSEIGEIKDPETGQKIVRKAWRKEDIYSGGSLERIPDIVVLLDEGYEGGGGMAGPLVTLKKKEDYDIWSGYHSMNGVLIVSGPAVRSGQKITDAEIVDITPTALYALGETVPQDMDGKVLVDLFEGYYLETKPVQYTADLNRGGKKSRYILSGEEEEEMKKKLRVLGYME